MKCLVSCVTYEPKFLPTTTCQKGECLLSNSFSFAISLSVLYLSMACWAQSTISTCISSHRCDILGSLWYPSSRSSSFLALSSVMSWFLISTLRPDSAMAVGGEGEEGCGERRPRAPARQDQAWRRGRRKLMDVWKDPGPGLSRRDRGAGQDSALGPGAA
ncbi:unnamed protein product, partial [Prorocentrum cordatum]